MTYIDGIAWKVAHSICLHNKRNSRCIGQLLKQHPVETLKCYVENNNKNNKYLVHVITAICVYVFFFSFVRYDLKA